MSTVLLTPTHIAGDHTVIHKSFPHKTVVDLHHRKLFIPPHRRFVIGVAGEYFPHLVDTKETYEAMETIFLEAIGQVKVTELGKDNSLIVISHAEVKHYKKVFDETTVVLMVSKSHRYYFKLTKTKQFLGFKRAEAYCGLGSGGMMGAGLMLGGVSLKDVWAKIQDMDPQTSREYTSIPLSSLKTWKLPDVPGHFNAGELT